MPEMAYLCWKIVMIRYRINDEKKLKIKNKNYLNYSMVGAVGSAIY